MFYPCLVTLVPHDIPPAFNNNWKRSRLHSAIHPIIPQVEYFKPFNVCFDCKSFIAAPTSFPAFSVKLFNRMYPMSSLPFHVIRNTFNFNFFPHNCFSRWIFFSVSLNQQSHLSFWEPFNSRLMSSVFYSSLNSHRSPESDPLRVIRDFCAGYPS